MSEEKIMKHLPELKYATLYLILLTGKRCHFGTGTITNNNTPKCVTISWIDFKVKTISSSPAEGDFYQFVKPAEVNGTKAPFF